MPSSVLAQSLDPAESVGALLTPVQSYSNLCDRGNDAINCTNRRRFLAAEVGGRIHTGDFVSFGPFLAMGFDLRPSRRTDDGLGRHTFASAGADVRFHPSGPRALWLGARLGGLGARDVEPRTGDNSTTAHYQVGYRTGAGLGYDWVAAQSIGMQFSLHFDHVWFPGSDLGEDRKDGWNSGLWISLGVGVVVDL